MTRRRTDAHDRGQATVELALALPIVLLFAVAAAQLGALGVRQLAIGNAARAGARAAAVARDPASAAREAAFAATSVRPLEVEVTTTGDTVRVTVRTTSHVGVGVVRHDVGLAATVAMRLEPP